MQNPHTCVVLSHQQVSNCWRDSSRILQTTRNYLWKSWKDYRWWYLPREVRACQIASYVVSTWIPNRKGSTFLPSRHYPLYPLSIGKNYNGRLSDSTIVIRLYGIDCPEIGMSFVGSRIDTVTIDWPLLSISSAAKFGKPTMPFGNEATEFTRRLVDKKIVRVKLLRKDQYNRAVAKVMTNGFLPFTKTDVTLRLAESGLATLYTGGGAEYDVCYFLIGWLIDFFAHTQLLHDNAGKARTSREEDRPSKTAEEGDVEGRGQYWNTCWFQTQDKESDQQPESGWLSSQGILTIMWRKDIPSYSALTYCQGLATWKRRESSAKRNSYRCVLQGL